MAGARPPGSSLDLAGRRLATAEKVPLMLGAWAAEGRPRAGPRRGAKRGADEAVWLTHTTNRQRRVAPRIGPALRVGSERGACGVAEPGR